MGNRYRIEVKKHEANSQNFVSKIRKPCYSKIRSSPIDRVLFLQRTIGNQAVQKLIKSRALQAKLRIGAPGDKYEQKADRVAEEVMRMPQPRAIDRHGSKPSIQRLCTSCEEKGFQKQHVEEDLEKLRMQPIDEDEEKLRKQSIEEDEEKNPQIEEIRGNCAETTSDVGSSIVAIRGGGQSLSETVRAYFEPRFSHDFSHVRVHAGMQADELARGVNARAFTIGSDIVFRAGQYAPQTFEGKRLLAHELTHVMQQSNEKSIIRRKIQFDPPNYIRENPISRILSERSVGLTTPTFNSEPLPDNSLQAANLVFKTLQPKETSYNPSTKECTFVDFAANVAANVIIPTEPKNNEWTMYFPGSDIKKYSECHDKGDVPVVMTGRPSSEISKWIEKNEQEHVDDLEELCKKYLQPHFDWLLSLKIKSDDHNKCPEILINALGKRDALVVKDFLSDLNESRKKRDAGGKHTLNNTIQIKDNCSRIEIESSK